MSKYVYLIITLLIVLGAAVTGLFYVLRQTPAPNGSGVVLNLSHPEEISSGDEVAFLVHYKNGTRVPLNDVSLFFHYPDGSVPRGRSDQRIETAYIGTLTPGQESTQEFRAQVLGQKDSIVKVAAELSYKSAGVAEFRKTAEGTMRIGHAAFFLNFEVPQRAVAGERILYILKYENLASRAFLNTQIRLKYSDGFTYADAEPAPTENGHIWDIGEVAAEGKGRITVSGILNGNEGDTRKVKAEIGFVRDDRFFPYAESSFDTVIAPPPLAIGVSLQDNTTGIAKRGDMLTVYIRYKNNTEVSIKDAVIRAELGGGMFLPRGISADRGFFDSTRGTVIWTPANVKELLFLNPGQEQMLTFRAKLADAFPIAELSDTNFVARIVATIESINVPPTLALQKISSWSLLEVKMQTAPDFAAWGRYRDDVSGIINIGPLPPRVNTETRYTIHWQVRVPANDLENVEIRATLPTGVVPTGEVQTYYTNSKPTFNETTGEVSWFIPSIPANTGILLPAYEAVFQVAATPSINQVDQTIELVRAATLSARDTFAGVEVSASALSIRSDQVSEDPALGKSEGRVQP